MFGWDKELIIMKDGFIGEECRLAILDEDWSMMLDGEV